MATEQTKQRRKYAVGEVRPSQLLLTYGVGSLIDLPHISTLVMGLDEWDTTYSAEITEERLLHAIQTAVGPQVQRLLSPPTPPTSSGSPFEATKYIGVPVATFPRWMVCPRCRLLAPVDMGYFELKANPYQPDKMRYIHHNCSFQPPSVVLPSRFMIACESGHLDDFPWVHFVHKGVKCEKPSLKLNEIGVSGEPSDLRVECKSCGAKRSMADAFSSDEEQMYHPVCRGRRPHLRDFERKTCVYQARTTLLAASNSWFPLIFSSLSIPTSVDTLSQLVEAQWPMLEKVENMQGITLLRSIGVLKQADEYPDTQVWAAVEQRKSGTTTKEIVAPGDLKIPEWQVLSHPQTAPKAADFEVKAVDAPDNYTHLFQQTVLVERLREVQALTGFTRIESLRDYAEEEELPTEHIMRLSRNALRWVPASEVRGEGLFLHFREDVVQTWTERPLIQQQHTRIYEAHRRWRKARHIEPTGDHYPGIRYVLLHTFAHALMRQLTLECGYTAASIRERIYAQPPSAAGGAMAGILLYTAASDSEGTLGGLVSLGKPELLSWHIYGALEEMQRCASDPLCAEHTSREDNTLHEAACHACLFVPETSCERGNRYLDRSLLVPTVHRSDLAFFGERR